MRALLKSGPRVTWTTAPRRGVVAPDDVEVAVEVAGICRTDLYAARGLIPAADPVILGHEFAGTVTAVGAAVDDLSPGGHVTASPLLDGPPGEPPRMVGVDLDGAFAEFITLPRALLYPVPATLSWPKAAYVEPVAASLAAVETPIDPTKDGAIVGDGRIADLTHRVLTAHGFERLQTISLPDAADMPPESLDYVIETCATTETFSAIFRLLRPGGTLVLKSRPDRPVPIDVLTAVRKELRLVGAHYGSFRRAIELLHAGLPVDDLLGPIHAPGDFERVFADLHLDETRKHFFAFGEALFGEDL